VAIMLGVNSLTTAGWLSWQFLGGLVLGIGALGAYVQVAKHSDKQLLKLEIFRNPIFTYSFFAYVILQFCNIGINFALPNYAQIVVGATSLIGGLMLLPGSLIRPSCNPGSATCWTSTGQNCRSCWAAACSCWRRWALRCGANV
jgi:hypothetical protein